MKKKVINIVLLIGVITIWMFVLKKATNILTDEKDTINITQVTVEPVEFPIFEKDTFNLISQDRDPFLDKKRIIPKKRGQSSSANNLKVKRIFKKKKQLKSAPEWPKIQYFGYIKGEDENRYLALIKVNNKLHRLREKESLDEIYVYAVFADSVILRRNKQLKTILK